MTVSIVIPFRDRGVDPLRVQNLKRVLQHWGQAPVDEVIVAGDGRDGDAQFNRSAAYNRGTFVAEGDVIVFSESDLIVDYDQIEKAVELAGARPGLVVPFSKFMAISESDSVLVREGMLEPGEADAVQQREDCRSIGAVNVVSRDTLAAVGRFDESFEGAWYDDDAMEIAFRVCCGGVTRFVDGPGWHLYHLPGAKGDHLSAADRLATARNKRRLGLYRAAMTPNRVRELTTGFRSGLGMRQNPI